MKIQIILYARNKKGSVYRQIIIFFRVKTMLRNNWQEFLVKNKQIF